jgi:hypothetical protein
MAVKMNAGIGVARSKKEDMVLTGMVGKQGQHTE